MTVHCNWNTPNILQGKCLKYTVIYRLLTQLFVGSHQTEVFGPADKHLRVRDNYADKMRLETKLSLG